MHIDNYLNLSAFPAQISLTLDRTASFRNVNHAHPGLEIIYVHEGRGNVILDECRHSIEAGTLIYYKPFQRHQVQMDTDGSQPYIRSMFLFEPSLLWSYFQPFDSLVSFLETLWKSRQVPQVVRVANPGEINDYLSRVAARYGAPSTAPYRMEENALLLLQLLHFLRDVFHRSQASSILPASPRQTISAAVKQLLSWIDRHYTEKCELKSMAALVHLSPNHLSYQFHKETGTSITEYLSARRLQHAGLLLQTTDQPIREIGLDTGFDNFSYFCKVFKEKFGVTPSAYRSQSGANAGLRSELIGD
ncbi:AraC family transcriptional regulator [Paenibacillus filicis]|uniref:AraC family transcriptional regulator n=1 Tax=Paenibacillus filicis TaxID=669464 RepID=A0ABU9DG89_9BACL